MIRAGIYQVGIYWKGIDQVGIDSGDSGIVSIPKNLKINKLLLIGLDPVGNDRVRYYRVRNDRVRNDRVKYDRVRYDRVRNDHGLERIVNPYSLNLYYNS